MLSPVWIATALGLAGGFLLAYALGRALLPRWVGKSGHLSLLVRLAFAGTVVALLPALLLSLVVGGTLGGAWGERVFAWLGFPSGAPIGLALGVALVFALVVLSGAACGVLLGKALARDRGEQP
jgi:RsiW-degrading membrane proteinase PrsW (M82 family)